MDKNPKLDFKKEQKEVILVKLSNNKRFVEDLDSSLTFINGEPTELAPRALKSYMIKQMLIDGDLRVVEGEIRFKLKNSSFIIRPEEMLYKEGENLYEKEFDTNQTVLLNESKKEKEDEKGVEVDFF